MPAEARYIVFSLEEINALMRRYAHARSLDLPEGRLARIERGDDGFALTFVTDYSRKHTLEVAGSVVMAAVLLDCRYQRVPVARGFSKRLEALGSGLALIAFEGCNPAPTCTALPGARTAVACA